MEVKKYVKKPVIVSAYQTDKDIIIHTLEGDMHAKKGDYIITGINGEKYPCKPDIFEKTYELFQEKTSKSKRLTARNEYGEAYYIDCFKDSAPCGGANPGKDCEGCYYLEQQCEKLAKYEDKYGASIFDE